MSSNRFTREIVNSLEEPILIIDRSYRIVDANDAAARMFGRTRRRMIGKPCHVMSHEEAKPCFENGIACPVKKVFETGERSRVLHLHFRANGERRWEEIIATPICDDDGVPVFVVEEVRDVSELLKSREMIEKLDSEIKTLEGILPICSHCRKIRNDEGSWEDFEAFLRKNSNAHFSHGLCPECVSHYPTGSGKS